MPTYGELFKSSPIQPLEEHEIIAKIILQRLGSNRRNVHNIKGKKEKGIKLIHIQHYSNQGTG